MRIVLPNYQIVTNLTPERVKEDLQNIEQAGRSCYLSQNLYTEDGESAKKFIKNRIKEGHEAIIEFADVYVQLCVDRGITHELVRHRLCSFAQESSRFCNYSLGKNGSQITVVLPSVFVDKIDYKFKQVDQGLTKVPIYEVYDINLDGADDNIKYQFDQWKRGCELAETEYMDMVNDGVKPEIARSVLPNSTKAIINMKANYREWRTIFKLRADNLHAHPDMVYIMQKMLSEFKEKIPVVFDDIYPEIVQS